MLKNLATKSTKEAYFSITVNKWFISKKLKSYKAFQDWPDLPEENCKFIFETKKEILWMLTVLILHCSMLTVIQ